MALKYRDRKISGWTDRDSDSQADSQTDGKMDGDTHRCIAQNQSKSEGVCVYNINLPFIY